MTARAPRSSRIAARANPVVAAATFGLAAWLAAAHPALGAVDLTGGWRLTGAGGLGDFSNGLVNFSQTGAVLTFTFPSPAAPFQVVPVGSAGTVDPDTGVFSARYDFGILFVACAAFIDGVASDDGLSFTATYSAACPSEFIFFGPVTVTGNRCGQGGVACCGNLLVEADELCDTVCCTADCQAHAAAGSACTTDGNVCTDDVCDAAGGCQHLPNTAPCGPPIVPIGFDPDWCAPRGTCAAGICNIAPCLEPTNGSRLRIGRQNGRAQWTWRDKTGAVASFGDPTLATAGTQYRLCLGKLPSFGGGYRTGAAPGDQWRPRSHGFRYKGIDGNLVGSVSLTASEERAVVKTVVGYGYSILPTPDPLTVRVVGIGPSPSCFEATYSHPTVNVPGRYDARD